MEKSKESKIIIGKIPNYKKSKNNAYDKNIKKNIEKKPIPLIRNQSLKQINNNQKLKFNDPFKQKILNRIIKSKSRQSIFSKSQYLFYGKNENNIKTNSALKSIIEMENKFYIRNKEGFENEQHSDFLYKIFTKKSKITLKNNKYGDGNNNFPFNFKKINDKIINNLIVSKKSIVNENNNGISLISDKSSSNYNKTKKSNSFSKTIDFNDEKNISMENIANYNIKIIKKILKKRIKMNSKILSNSMINLGENNYPYEIINKRISNRKIGQNIYINRANLSRLISVNKIVRNGFNEDDDINNIKKIKNFSRNFQYNKVHVLPKSVKTKHFSRSTIYRFNQFYGNYFGVPV